MAPGFCSRLCVLCDLGIWFLCLGSTSSFPAKSEMCLQAFGQRQLYKAPPRRALTGLESSLEGSAVFAGDPGVSGVWKFLSVSLTAPPRSRFSPAQRQGQA